MAPVSLLSHNRRPTSNDVAIQRWQQIQHIAHVTPRQEMPPEFFFFVSTCFKVLSCKRDGYWLEWTNLCNLLIICAPLPAKHVMACWFEAGIFGCLTSGVMDGLCRHEILLLPCSRGRLALVWSTKNHEACYQYLCLCGDRSPLPYRNISYLHRQISTQIHSSIV